ncbi:hypothetical protein EWM64_g2845 [Hericium alpestre]|uniref:Peptidase M64 N-terminal domain-containing protein n=1 Tax=Hericium alpestre TaxID=135208 RepID=A0A4Z0A4B6_9AGAM|nr:hypothetical protein EWM64_g2845 [Hericium alpestre]
MRGLLVTTILLVASVSITPGRAHRYRRLGSNRDTYIAESSTEPSHDGKQMVERLRLYSYNEHLLREKFSTLCDDAELHKDAFRGPIKAIPDPSFRAPNPVLAAPHTQQMWLPVPDGPEMKPTNIPEYDCANITKFVPSRSSVNCIDVSISPQESLPFIMQNIAGSEDSSNRIDLTFFADGYLHSEHAKFIKDVTRLVEEISGNQTFHTVAPLLNFWAAFVPSKESGVGTGGKPKDTPFGLYRDGTELRGLYYARPEAARNACQTLQDRFGRCDYPILIGNDPYYGGLGGEFVTITPSEVNGALVLRHELGHSVIEVGEEYDGGFAYFGPNSASDASGPVPWAHWLADTHAAASPESSLDLPRVERSVMPMQAYPWTLLNITTPWSVPFNSSGTYSRHLVRFSLSGLPEESDLQVLFDGEDLGWTPKPGLGLDRWHYDIYRDGALSGGEHTIQFVLKEGRREGVAQLCSVEVLEFGSAEEFNAAPGFYGVFPTYAFHDRRRLALTSLRRFSETNATSYRPTNEDCLMRLTTTPHFCRACVEGLWLSLLGRVDPIDDLTATCVQDAASKTWKHAVNATLLPLGQFRAEAPLVKESYTISWKKDGRALEDFANKTVVLVDDGDDALGVYEVGVEFVTEEVRSDPDGLLKTGAKVHITEKCNQ